MKKLKSEKKVFKGMTLVEIIVSIAVLAIMTTVLVAASKAIQAYLRSSEEINDRVAVQAPVAQAGYQPAAEMIEEEIEIFIFPTIGETDAIRLVGELYGVYDATEMADHEDEAGNELNIKFIKDIETTTAGATNADGEPSSKPEKNDGETPEKPEHNEEPVPDPGHGPGHE